MNFDNIVSSFFGNHLDKKLSLIQNLLGLWHSYIEPQFIWTSPWPFWKRLFMKLLKYSFLSVKFDNVVSTFFVNHLGQKLSLIQNLLGLWHSCIEPQFIWSFEQVLAYIENDFLWNCISTVFEREIWQRSNYFFLEPPTPKTITHSEPNRVMTLLHRPSIHLNKSLTILKMTFFETAPAQFLSVKFDNEVSTFFVNHLD